MLQDARMRVLLESSGFVLEEVLDEIGLVLKVRPAQLGKMCSAS